MALVTTTEAEKVMKRCQIGTRNYHELPLGRPQRLDVSMRLFSRVPHSGRTQMGLWRAAQEIKATNCAMDCAWREVMPNA